MTCPPARQTSRVHHRGEHPEHVLHPDDGGAGLVHRADRPDQRLGLRVAQPAGDLVEQQDARPHGQRPGQFQALAVEQPQRAGRACWPGRPCRSRLQRLVRRPVGVPPAQPGRPHGADQRVLEHGQARRAAVAPGTCGRAPSGPAAAAAAGSRPGPAAEPGPRRTARCRSAGRAGWSCRRRSGRRRRPPHRRRPPARRS